MKSPRMFPDVALCKTRHVHGRVYQCVADDACRCPHNLAFAYSYYCNHPDGKDFSRKAGGEMPASVDIVADDPWHVTGYLAGT